jgi:D-sedoheptulose 7-phosphate isomerase
MADDHLLSSFADAQDALRQFIADSGEFSKVRVLADQLADVFRRGGHVYSCGNGGSMCDAMHFAEEFTGRYRSDREPLPAMALSDPAHMSCVANDYGYDKVFARQVRAHGRSGDMLLLISTSGNSPNLLRAAEDAHAKGMKVAGLLGKSGGRLKDLCDLSIIVPGATSDRIQELHIKIIHVAIELVERELFPELYDA